MHGSTAERQTQFFLDSVEQQSFFTSKINGGQQRADLVIPFDCFSRFSSGIPLVKFGLLFCWKEKKRIDPPYRPVSTKNSRRTAAPLVGFDVAARPHFQLPTSTHWAIIMMHYERSKSQVFQVPSALAVANTAPDANRFGECICILMRWKGSIYKLVWRNLLVYYTLYYMLTILHKFILDEDGQKTFTALAKYCSRNENSFNFMIMLGFFTSTAMQRLFAMQTMMPGTAKVIGCFTLAIKPNMPEGPFIVEQFARWTVISWILTFRLVSKPLRDIYPDMFSLQTAGILRDKERLILERADADDNNSTPRPLVAIDWMLLLLKETSNQNRFVEKSSHLKLVEAVLAFKKSCGNTIKFGTQNIPHALIQAAIIIVYAFGLLTLMARNLDEENEEENKLANNIVSYFPILPSMQFFIFLAWLKFGRAAVNPFGTDETDIDIKHLLKTHIQDSLRLTKLYTQNLEDFFGMMPQHQYNEPVTIHSNVVHV